MSTNKIQDDRNLKVVLVENANNNKNSLTREQKSKFALYKKSSDECEINENQILSLYSPSQKNFGNGGIQGKWKHDLNPDVCNFFFVVYNILFVFFFFLG
jgi:hypothetical protein